MHINTIIQMAVPVKKSIDFVEKYSHMCWRVLFLLLVIFICVACSEKKSSTGIVSTPSEIDFGSSKSTAQFSLVSTDGKSIPWSIKANQSWVVFSETKGLAGNSPKKITVNIDRNKLRPGNRKAEISVIYDGGQLNIPLSLFSVSQAAIDVVAEKIPKKKLTDQIRAAADDLPTNTTAANFIDGGALETNSNTITVNISAEDKAGIVAFYINDSDSVGLFDVQMIGSGGWKKITETKRYKGIVSHAFQQGYISGSKVHVSVWFKGIQDRVSVAARDTIIYNLPETRRQQIGLNGNNKNTSVVLGGRGSLTANSPLVLFSPGNAGSGMKGSVSGLSSRVTDDENEKLNEVSIFFSGFENGYDDWWVDNGQWEIGVPLVGPTSGCFKSTQCAGTVLSGPYSDYIESRLISPAIALPALGDYRRIQLSFKHWYALHLHDLVKLQISVETAPGVWGRWKTLSTQSGYTRKWKVSASGLSNYASKTIRLGFYLYQPPDKAGAREGWYVDDVSIMMVR